MKTTGSESWIVFKEKLRPKYRKLIEHCEALYAAAQDDDSRSRIDETARMILEEGIARLEGKMVRKLALTSVSIDKQVLKQILAVDPSFNLSAFVRAMLDEELDRLWDGGSPRAYIRRGKKQLPEWSPSQVGLPPLPVAW